MITNRLRITVPWLQLLLAVLAPLTGSVALACAICAPTDAQNTLVHRLFAADVVVLAAAGSEPGHLQPIESIKGELPKGSVRIAEWLDGAAPRPSAAPVLLLYSAATQSWRAAGTLGLQRVAWLRRIVALKPVSLVADPDWAGRLSLFAADLQDVEPLVAQAAYEELSIAPYSAMRHLKPLLVTSRLRRWVDDPALAARWPLFTLLLGLSGGADDAMKIERQLSQSPDAAAPATLAARIAAYLELRGATGVTWLEREYLGNPNRSEAAIQAAVLGLGVHGNDGVRVPRDRVVAAYSVMIARNRRVAGFAASDLASWGRWEYGARYADILRSGEPLVFASRYAMVFYLLRSPRPEDRAALEALRAAKVL